jgi:hypothetical protein
MDKLVEGIFVFLRGWVLSEQWGENGLGHKVGKGLGLCGLHGEPRKSSSC